MGWSLIDRFNHVPDVGETEVRVALLTVLRVNGVEWCHVNTHLEAFTSTVRDAQLKVLLDDIEDLCPRRSVVIAGDFNSLEVVAEFDDELNRPVIGNASTDAYHLLAPLQ